MSIMVSMVSYNALFVSVMRVRGGVRYMVGVSYWLKLMNASSVSNQNDRKMKLMQ